MKKQLILLSLIAGSVAVASESGDLRQNLCKLKTFVSTQAQTIYQTTHECIKQNPQTATAIVTAAAACGIITWIVNEYRKEQEIQERIEQTLRDYRRYEYKGEKSFVKKVYDFFLLLF